MVCELLSPMTWLGRKAEGEGPSWKGTQVSGKLCSEWFHLNLQGNKKRLKTGSIEANGLFKPWASIQDQKSFKWSHSFKAENLSPGLHPAKHSGSTDFQV
jgi:hypothetical protein